MKLKFTLVSAILCSILSLNAQEKNEIQKLDTVLIKSTRIDVPFKESARTIQIITAETIKRSAATNVADLLQQVAGVDIRRRGTGGSQADLFIRGGGFDQTLLLIDGIKMDDAQTGHHTLNAALPIEVIERIEIVKGPAARIFGQNAFTGAINIVTKKKLNSTLSANVEGGSFGQINASATFAKETENSTFIAHFGTLNSDGYNTNLDYKNYNYFFKGIFNKNKQSINVIATFFDKKFGAQNFYTPPSFGLNEYEETQNSLVAVSTTFRSENFKITPRVYWRRSQDIFLLQRDNPAFYRNLHITNKVGAEANASYSSKLGVTGFGLDVSRVSISSNNLGKRDRIMANLFLEHRFKTGPIDITPGVAVTYFSDFKFHAFPGLDLGMQLSDKLRYYWNFGYTYRIPTYTDLYYNDSSTSGNPNLLPEEAIAQEMGLKYSNNNFFASFALFTRASDNLIDFIRPDANTNVFMATNIAKVNTQGFEFDANYSFKFKGFNQSLAVGYTFLEDDIQDQNRDLSRYSLNTLKHHFTTGLRTQLFKNVSQNIIYKHAERIDGQSYNVWDASIIVSLNKLEFNFTANNIFNAEYVESGFLPMPLSNVLFGLRYSF
ncbi:MAG: TonB-dependent receptor [Flavobacteriaceae bacterium]|nr:TonB-dependent receptor [Flavobacteriaceae bacterium]